MHGLNFIPKLLPEGHDWERNLPLPIRESTPAQTYIRVVINLSFTVGLFCWIVSPSMIFLLRYDRAERTFHALECDSSFPKGYKLVRSCGTYSSVQLFGIQEFCIVSPTWFSPDEHSPKYI